MNEKCETTDHRFAKFDDATIFCRRCGEQRVVDVKELIAQLPQPIYLPCPHPHWGTGDWYRPWWGTTTTGTITVSDTSTFDPNTASFT